MDFLAKVMQKYSETELCQNKGRKKGENQGLKATPLCNYKKINVCICLSIW